MLWFPKGENYTVGNKSSKKAGGGRGEEATMDEGEISFKGR